MNVLTPITKPVTLNSSLSQFQNATWDDYLTYRNYYPDERIKLYFIDNKLLIEMGTEGINHSSISDLFTMLFFAWFSQQPNQLFASLGRCLLEKPNKKSGAPDLVLYLGEDYPQWQPGTRRYIDLDKWRSPDLVGEISDTTLAIDLDEKKHLYADLGIKEYWVIDVQAKRIFAFELQENNKYEIIENSVTLSELSISLLEETLNRLETESNGMVANWFLQKITEITKVEKTDL
jgi:Uma2 family endonuclease